MREPRPWKYIPAAVYAFSGLSMPNPLSFNAIKRLTPHFMALRATFPPPEKIFFSALKSCVLNDLK